MVLKIDEGAAQEVVKHANLVMEEKGDEWIGRSEETLGRKSETRAVNIKYAKGGGADLTETTTLKEKDSSEKWSEAGTVVKKMHFDSLNRPSWIKIEFIFGSWRYPVNVEVQKENERMDKSSPDIVKTDFGPKKIEGITKLFGGPKGTIFGSSPDSIYASLSNTDNLIYYTETIEGEIGVTQITVHLERRYEKQTKAFESLSADISVDDGVTKRTLEASVHLEHERAKFSKFISQQPVQDWRKEMELKTGNLR